MGYYLNSKIKLIHTYKITHIKIGAILDSTISHTSFLTDLLKFTEMDLDCHAVPQPGLTQVELQWAPKVYPFFSEN